MKHCLNQVTHIVIFNVFIYFFLIRTLSFILMLIDTDHLTPPPPSPGLTHPCLSGFLLFRSSDIHMNNRICGFSRSQRFSKSFGPTVRLRLWGEKKKPFFFSNHIYDFDLDVNYAHITTGADISISVICGADFLKVVIWVKDLMLLWRFWLTVNSTLSQHSEEDVCSDYAAA